MLFRKTVLGMVFTMLLWASAHAYEYRLLSEISLKGKASAITVNTAADTAVVASETARSLTIIDTALHAISREVPLPAAPSCIAVHKGENKAVVGSLEGSLYLIELESGEITTLNAGSAVYAVSVDETNNTAVLGVEGGIRVIDLTDGGLVSTISLQGKTALLCKCKPNVIAVNRVGNGSTMKLVDPASGSATREVAAEGVAASVALEESLGYLLLTRADKPGLALYNATTLQPMGEIPTGKQAEIVAVNPSTHTAVLSDTLDGSLTIVDLERQVVIGTIPLFGQAGPVDLDVAKNRALAANGEKLLVLQLENPLPRISGIVPEEGASGETELSLSITGEKFIKESQTGFNGESPATQFESNEQLKAVIPSDKLLSPGNVPVSVTNPPPGGGVSNEVTFKVLTPAPQLTGLNPAIVVKGSPSFKLRIEGKNFLPTAIVNFNGKKIEGGFASSTLLEVPIDASAIAVKGAYPVTVTSKGPTSFTSTPLYLDIVTEEEAAKLGSGSGIVILGTGSLGGRILNTEMQPLKGVTIRYKAASVSTDQYGNFSLESLPAGNRTILIDGSTAEEANGHYPVIPISVDIEVGKHNLMPFTPYLHRQKSYNFVNINPAADTILTDPEVPGFEMRIPAGVNITGWDGNKNLKVSVRTVPTDRLPVKPLPKNSFIRTVYMFYFDKVGGGKPDRPILIKAPNDLGLLPGEKAVLWYYDESPNEGEAPNDWAIAGTGTVTPDGRFIVSDPGSGIPKFCCGASAFGGGGAGAPASGCSDGTCGSPPNNAGDPVNLATGYFIHEKTDYRVNGIIPVELKRFYRSGDPVWGAFGAGTYFGFDWWLGIYSDMLLLIKPGNYRYQFAKQPDGTFINTTDPEYIGDVFYNNGNGTYTLRKKSGWSWTFASDHLLNGIADPNGNALTFTRDSNGNIGTINLPDGRQIAMTYIPTDRNNITSITGPMGTVTYTYYNNGSTGKLKSVQYPDGSTISYTYDASNRLNTITENGKLVVTNVYNTDNRVTSQTHPDGGVYTFNYTLSGGSVTETAMTAPNGAQTTWRFYDDGGAYHNGYVTKMTTPDGITTYEREGGTNLIKSVTDPLLRRTSYIYDTRGRRASMTDPVGNITSYQYEDACNNLTTFTDPLAKSTSIAYTFATGTCRKTRAEVRDPLQNLTVIEYDTYGMPTRITDPNGNATTLAYAPSHPGQLSSISDPLGNTVNYGYDDLWRLTSVTDAKGAKTTYGYDLMDQVTSVTDPSDGTTRYLYDGNSNLAMVIDAKGNTIRYEYDDRNRITKMTDQLGRYETYSYYRNAEITATTGDNLKSYTDRKGQTTTFNEYDAINRLKKVTFGDASFIQYTYDAVGRATNINDSISGAINYTYNDYGCGTCSGRGLDLISQELTPLGTIDYTYDKDGRRLTMTVAGEPVVNYTWDDAGRMTKLSRSINGTVKDFSFTYDNGSRRTNFQVPLYKSQGKWKYLKSDYGYDIANHLTSLLHQNPTTTVESLTYTYDPNGNRKNYTRTAAQTLSPTVSSTTHDAANEMLALSTKNFTYDLNGNLVTRTDACGTTTYTWDARNRLTGIVNGYKPDCSPFTASFTYDSLNRRISKTVDSVTTQYVYDGWDVTQEIKAGIKTNYVRTLNIDEPLARTNSTTTRYYLLDALGSVIGLTDENGVSKTTYVYDAFGNTTTSGEASDNPFQYTARENDGTGLYHYRFRYYSPEMQRFISEDPIRLRGGINYFSYVQNNPVNWIDPLGLYIGQYPPAPPGYNPATWTTGMYDDGTSFLRDPNGNKWLPHPEDPTHWRHWDKQDPNGKDDGRWPPNSKKPWPNQKKPKKDQCSTDPSGDAPEYQWPISFLPLDPAMPGMRIPSRIPMRIPIRIPIPVW